MVYDVQSHRLRQAGKPVPFQESPNKGGAVRPLYLIMHYTAGTSADGAIKWLADARAKASAHLVVDRSGSVTQLVPFNRIAWHAGKSRWNELDGMNAFSLGIEIVNAGKLRRNERGQWVNWASTIIPDEEVTVATHKNESSATGSPTPAVSVRSASRRSRGRWSRMAWAMSRRWCPPKIASSSCRRATKLR